jgi:hypothetical protein
MILRDLMIPALWLASFGRRGFTWRGNTMIPGSIAPTNSTPTGRPAGIVPVSE